MDVFRSMSEQKPHQFRPPLYGDGSVGLEGQSPPTRASDAARERQGWDAYRKWLSGVGRQSAERAPVDPSVYSWRGYNSWAERIRQTWKSDEP
jgi:hypothetical protein